MDDDGDFLGRPLAFAGGRPTQTSPRSYPKQVTRKLSRYSYIGYLRATWQVAAQAHESYICISMKLKQALSAPAGVYKQTDSILQHLLPFTWRSQFELLRMSLDMAAKVARYPK